MLAVVSERERTYGYGCLLIVRVKQVATHQHIQRVPIMQLSSDNGFIPCLAKYVLKMLVGLY